MSEIEKAQCLNCGSTLGGQYCAHCGQRGDTRLISLYELIREAFGSFFDVDSRLWQTLIPLLTRPGFLTAEYLRGKRASYMPPFRMYLVLSFIFFLLSNALDDDNQVTISAGADADGGLELVPGLTPSDNAAENDEANQAAQARRGISDGLESAAIDNRADQSTGNEDGADAAGSKKERCQIDYDKEDIDWLDRYITEERARAVCHAVLQDNGRRFLEKVAQNTPIAAIALLPLLALLLKLLYPLSRRYYVEHLLLLVHYHSFAFLLMSLGYLYSYATSLLPPIGWPQAIPLVVVTLYLPFYLYKAMRRVYQQHRLATVFKYLALLLGYLAAVSLLSIIVLLYIILTY